MRSRVDTLCAGPSPLWAQKHIIIQACRDYEVAIDIPSYEERVQEEECTFHGRLTHYLCQHLRSYASELETVDDTYLELITKLLSYGQTAWDAQHLVYFVGDTRKYTQFLSTATVIPKLGQIHVEASDGVNAVLSAGFAG